MMNQLLSYVSYKGSGTMADLFSTCRTLGLDQPWAGLRGLSDLGHLEFTWLERSGWSVATAVVATLPISHSTGVLCGGRSPLLMQRLQQSPLSFETRPQPSGPDAWFLRAASPEELIRIASAEGLTCPSSPPAWLLARCLSPLEDYIRETSPLGPFPNTYTPELYDPAKGQFTLRTMVTTDGLWRYRDQPRGGRIRYLLRLGSEFRQVGDPDAVRLWLRIPGQSFARYDMTTQSVHWRRGHPLPRLYARALVLCSGQLPVAEGEFLMYEKVPQSLALLVFGRLGLRAKEVAVA